ncbi:hypothetical protein [Streptomyces sp. HB132]|uniref:hypothetical protein n=1 Tax=Streptomyces sp. HB132 TaxID=767388 RepID=UPI00195F8113|nr:hypothetical protein [Streptomyces sp. HB132]MBM7437998.1 hypothetical protein [Streptomyces sp. HB132]
MKKAYIYLVAACVLVTVSCGGSGPIETSRLTDREREWVEFSYTREKNEDTKRMWEQLPAEGGESHVKQQRLRLCGDTAAVMRSLKEAGTTAEEMQEYEANLGELLC